MKFQLKHQHAVLACLLLSPFAAFAADIEINGTCIQGTCPPPSGTSDALQQGQSNASPGSYTPPYSLVVNGDTYSIGWTYADSYSASGTEIIINPVATFVSGPSTTTDTINFDFYQNYYTPGDVTYDGSFFEHVPLVVSADAGAGSSATGELFYDGQGLGPVTQTGPGSTDVTNSANLTGLDSSTHSAEYEFTYIFGPTSAPGSSISSPSVPEPAQTIPLALAGLGALAFRLRRRFVRS